MWSSAKPRAVDDLRSISTGRQTKSSWSQWRQRWWGEQKRPRPPTVELDPIARFRTIFSPPGTLDPVKPTTPPPPFPYIDVDRCHDQAPAKTSHFCSSYIVASNGSLSGSNRYLPRERLGRSKNRTLALAPGFSTEKHKQPIFSKSLFLTIQIIEMR